MVSSIPQWCKYCVSGKDFWNTTTHLNYRSVYFKYLFKRVMCPLKTLYIFIAARYCYVSVSLSFKYLVYTISVFKSLLFRKSVYEFYSESSRGGAISSCSDDALVSDSITWPKILFSWFILRFLLIALWRRC